jgi:hypothetical protein
VKEGWNVRDRAKVTGTKVTGTRCGGRRAAWLAAATAAVAGGGLLAGAGPAFAADPSCGGLSEGGGFATVTCAYTGSAQSWMVPAGVTEATITLDGGQGGNSGVGFTDWPQSVGGKGATVTATYAGQTRVHVRQSGDAAPGSFVADGPPDKGTGRRKRADGQSWAKLREWLSRGSA